MLKIISKEIEILIVELSEILFDSFVSPNVNVLFKIKLNLWKTDLTPDRGIFSYKRNLVY